MTQDERTVEFPVSGGMCRLRFRAGCSTGVDDDTRPGISFDFISETSRLISDRDGFFWGGTGVIGRRDAKRLADMINEFITEHPHDPR